jgi:hypothetical protein
MPPPAGDDMRGGRAWYATRDDDPAEVNALRARARCMPKGYALPLHIRINSPCFLMCYGSTTIKLTS